MRPDLSPNAGHPDVTVTLLVASDGRVTYHNARRHTLSLTWSVVLRFLLVVGLPLLRNLPGDGV